MVPPPSLSVIRYPASPFLHEERVFASLWPAWPSAPSATGRPRGRRPSPGCAKKQLEQWEAIPSASESMVPVGRKQDCEWQAVRLSDDESIAPEGLDYGYRGQGVWRPAGRRPKVWSPCRTSFPSFFISLRQENIPPAGLSAASDCLGLSPRPNEPTERSNKQIIIPTHETHLFPVLLSAFGHVHPCL